MRKADNLPPYCDVVKKSRSLNFLDPSGPTWPVTGVLCFLEVNGGHVIKSTNSVGQTQERVFLDTVLPNTFQQENISLSIATSLKPFLQKIRMALCRQQNR